MEVRSIHRYARISPFKAREVTREIQGLPVSAALDVLAFTPKKAALLINQTLKSAIANAENNANLKVDGLVVNEDPRAGKWSADFETHESHSDRFDGREAGKGRAKDGREAGKCG
jgi:ribosomal protein L22